MIFSVLFVIEILWNFVRKKLNFEKHPKKFIKKCFFSKIFYCLPTNVIWEVDVDDDGVWDYDDDCVGGCTDSTACDYDPDAIDWCGCSYAADMFGSFFADCNGDCCSESQQETTKGMSKRQQQYYWESRVDKRKL